MTFEYTKPRVPVAANYGSPGPCYALPSLLGHQDHDPRSDHYRGPAYTMGRRKTAGDSTNSPGPCYAFDAKLYNTGKDGAPRYSIHGRRKTPVFFNTPGPGTDEPEKCDSAYRHKAPAYSFGGRHPQRTTSKTPGPNDYRVPNTIGRTVESNKRQAPSFSVKSRTSGGIFGDGVQKTPGPAAYGAVDTKNYKIKPPGYSMGAKTKMAGDATNSPGPAAHESEKVWVHKRTQPRASFGIRHSALAVPLIVR